MTKANQRPSFEEAGLVSFGGSEEDLHDDSLSLMASEGEDWSGLVIDPAPPSQSSKSDARASTDAEVLHVLPRAVEELGLDWSSPEEPTRSRLDEWFLPGHQQDPHQRSVLFFPEVHDELTKSWKSFRCSR